MFSVHQTWPDNHGVEHLCGESRELAIERLGVFSQEHTHDVDSLPHWDAPVILGLYDERLAPEALCPHLVADPIAIAHLFVFALLRDALDVLKKKESWASLLDAQSDRLEGVVRAA